jgi:uncharacterized membrane protein
MTGRGRYLSGLAVVAAVGALVIGRVSPAVRQEVAWGIGLALVVQAPLGWFTVRSVGTGRFQMVWALGMLVRLGLVAVAGLVLVPALHWQMAPTLAGLVGTILVLLLVEVLTVMRENSGIEAR